jgi:hypothetical protein
MITIDLSDGTGSATLTDDNQGCDHLDELQIYPVVLRSTSVL